MVADSPSAAGNSSLAPLLTEGKARGSAAARFCQSRACLAREESRLLGTRGAVGMAQAWWRPLHIALAWIFALGVAIHVLAVTFFAGYVAGGKPITWWHLAAWGAGW